MTTGRINQVAAVGEVPRPGRSTSFSSSLWGWSSQARELTTWQERRSSIASRGVSQLSSTTRCAGIRVSRRLEGSRNRLNPHPQIFAAKANVLKKKKKRVLFKCGWLKKKKKSKEGWTPIDAYNSLQLAGTPLPPEGGEKATRNRTGKSARSPDQRSRHQRRAQCHPKLCTIRTCFGTFS